MSSTPFTGHCVYCDEIFYSLLDEPSLHEKQEAGLAHMKTCVKHPYYDQHKRTLDAYQARAEQTAIYRVKIKEMLDPIKTAIDSLCPTTDRKKEATRSLEKVHWVLSLWYPVLGMCGEAGEIANKIKKILRDGTFDPLDLGKEDGDVLWYVADFASQLVLSLELIADGNLDKLAKRKLIGKIEGSGDNR